MVTPVLCAALSAAASFYFFPFFLKIIFLFILMGSICFFHTVLGDPVFLSKTARYHFRCLRVFTIAAGVGFFIGVAAGNGKASFVSLGLAREHITGVSGVLRNDPRAFLKGGGMGNLALTCTRDVKKNEASAFGTIRAFFPEDAIPRLKEFGRGSEVYLEGEFAPLEGNEEDQTFYTRSVFVVKPAPALEQFRTNARFNIASRLSEYEWGNLSLALLFGVKDGLDSEVSRGYRDAGCAHVLALSGMHLAVLSALLAFFLKKALGLRASAIAGAVFVIGYVCFVGNLPSLNRAAIMYLLGTLVLIAGLPHDSLSIFSLSFILQIVIFPEDGKSLSFILSYLALAGILVLTAPLFHFFRGKLPDFAAMGLSASIAAFLGTAGVSSAVFGVLRPIGIIAGLIIAPLIMFFMFGSILALFACFTAPPATHFIGQGLSFLYNILERLVSYAGLAPPLAVSNAGAVTGICVLVAAFVFIARERQNRRLLLFLERRRYAGA
jgi:competence protein ComEC